MCLGLITARERELAEEDGVQMERPYFADEPPKAKVVSMQSIGRPNKEAKEDKE